MYPLNIPSHWKQFRIILKHLHHRPARAQARRSSCKNIRGREKPVKRPSSEGERSSNASISSSKLDSEPIRLIVGRTLKEQLQLKAFSDHEQTSKTRIPKLSTEEINEFAKATEIEIYNYFSCDIGNKYRAKYRSLIFNIKDGKNQTLFAKICGKLLEPKQLMRMSPEEMASQELV
ncbi:PHD finger protein 3-like [Glossina fuscipes]|uniref:PHD finger protein 3-like n=1 Tax=Glossina fuscipes TaxID=7396 RepID=A0A9C5Z300_9MUSC|nr:PHD finger protein 3-like [Glossina fuscipes]